MNKTTTILFTGLIFGLGWAIRGHFGHEWGAAWAGCMGGIAILVASGRKDWWYHSPVLTLLAGVGWAVGGMMSYGIVIGYCRGIDFLNVAYGYTMLAIIGGLYGCIGGGLLGMGLESSPQKRPQWASMFSEMVAGAILFWGLFIYQMEWFMTPPRSELWAACLGAAIAMLWYLYRNGFLQAYRVAIYTALGAGFGFSFGNFLQTLGHASGMSYNWWNVMEFTLGFCGGSSMAYAIITGTWPNKGTASINGNLSALLAVVFFIPLSNFIAAFSIEKMTKLGESLEFHHIEQFVIQQQVVGLIVMFIFIALSIFIWLRFKEKAAVYLLFMVSLYYILFSFIIKGIIFQPFDLGNSITTYIPILLFAFGVWWFNRNKQSAWPSKERLETLSTGFKMVGILFLIILAITFISINVHDGLGGYHERF